MSAFRSGDFRFATTGILSLSLISLSAVVNGQTVAQPAAAATAALSVEAASKSVTPAPPAKLTPPQAALLDPKVGTDWVRVEFDAKKKPLGMQTAIVRYTGQSTGADGKTAT